MKLVITDFNGKVIKEYTYMNTIDIRSIHVNNYTNVMELVNFAASRYIVVSSMYFPHPGIHQTIWISSNGVTKNQHSRS